MSNRYGANGQVYLGHGVSPMVAPSPEVFEMVKKAREIDEPKPIKINWELEDGESS